MIGTAKSANTFTACCNQGEVQIPTLLQPPPYLFYLLSSLDTEARVFRNHIRQYNSALAFTSMKYTVDDRIHRAMGGIQCFQIHGEVFHIQGPLQYENQTRAQFAQLYFYDPEFATSLRLQQNPQTLQQSVLQRITEELLAVNPFIAIYKTAKERLEAVEEQVELRVLLNPQLKLIIERGADRRRENLPTSMEIAMIIPDEYGEVGSRDIVLADRNGPGFSTISSNHAAYMALHYVLLFPYGEHGWHWALQLQNLKGQRKQVRLSQRAFYRFRLHIRFGEPKTLFYSQCLFQQYIVDAWAVCDQNKLLWLCSNQSRLRTDLYNGLADTLVQVDVNLQAVGHRIILPSSFTGGDRFMQ